MTNHKDNTKNRVPTRREQYLGARRANSIRNRAFTIGWLFPALIAVVVLAAAWSIYGMLDLEHAQAGEQFSARLTWGMSAMFFAVLFVFAVVVCNMLMFRCGRDEDAMCGLILTTAIGIIAVVGFLFRQGVYLGPDQMHTELKATAFCLPGVRLAASTFNGFACWSAVLVIVTSCVIARHEVSQPEELSRQLRGARMLMYTAAALLIAGVTETSALNNWPAHDHAPAAQCMAEKRLADSEGMIIKSTALSISTTVGAAFSLVLVAAYLPLAIILRQRAYRIVTPWERTEAWLAIHGLALQPTQQLAKVFLVLGPLIAGGPVSYLVTLLSSHG